MSDARYGQGGSVFLRRGRQLEMRSAPGRLLGRVMLKAGIGHVLVAGERDGHCSVCLLDIDEADSGRCECGADYHQACMLFASSCVRCDAPVTQAPSRRFSPWFPKIPHFSDRGGEQVLSSFSCLSCLAPVSADDRHCGSCGMQLATMEGLRCIVCSCEVADGCDYCRYCGTAYCQEPKVFYRCPCCHLLSDSPGMCGCGYSMH